MDELANALTHGIGLLLALVAVPTLIVLAATHGTVWHVVGVSVYGATLISLYTASTMYHAVRHPPAKRILRILDHSALARVPQRFAVTALPQLAIRVALKATKSDSHVRYQTESCSIRAAGNCPAAAVRNLHKQSRCILPAAPGIRSSR